mgnify:CR=1 FL=1
MTEDRENLRQLFLDFIDNQPDDEWDDTYRGIGNAVSVPVARAVGEAIMPLLV